MAVGECSLVFATNGYWHDAFFYFQLTLPKKVRPLGAKDPLLNLSLRASGNLVTCKSVAGTTYLCYDSRDCVSDVAFESIRVLNVFRVERHQNTSVTKAQPVKVLRRLPNRKTIAVL